MEKKFNEFWEMAKECDEVLKKCCGLENELWNTYNKHYEERSEEEKSLLYDKICDISLVCEAFKEVILSLKYHTKS